MAIFKVCYVYMLLLLNLYFCVYKHFYLGNVYDDDRWLFCKRDITHTYVTVSNWTISFCSEVLSAAMCLAGRCYINLITVKFSVFSDCYTSFIFLSISLNQVFCFFLTRSSTTYWYYHSPVTWWLEYQLAQAGHRRLSHGTSCVLLLNRVSDCGPVGSSCS